MNKASVNTEHYLYTELKQLLKSDDKIFEFIESSSLDGMWFWDLEKPENEWMSPTFWQTLGYSAEDMKHLASEWQGIINQEDFSLALENFEKHCNDANHPYDQIVRYTHKNGKTVWIRCRGIAIRDEYGKPIRMLGAHTDITALKEHEIKRIEQATKQKLVLQKQADLLKELEQTANIGTWEVDLKTNEVIWSEQTKRIHEVPFNYKPSIESGIAFYKPGESQKLITEAVSLGIEQGKSWDLELELVTYKGNSIWVKALGKPMFENEECVGLFGVFQDITRQKEIEQKEKLMRERAEAESIRLQLANDALGLGVWEWDLKTDELHWDDWMYELYGIDKAKFSGAFDAWESAVYPDDIDKTKALLNKAIRENVAFDTQFRITGTGGETKHIKANAKVIHDDSQNAVRVVGVNYDITERVNTLEVLESEKLKAESAAQAKTEFLANMSHEIRTPMNAILGGLQLLQQLNLSDNNSKVLDNAAFSAQSLLSIINDILDFSKIESNKLVIEKAPFSVVEVLESVKYDVDALVSNKAIDLIITMNKSVSEHWVGDIVRVKQIILNLVTNAVKFTNQGSVEIKLSTHKQQGRQALKVEVIDTGIGMSTDMQSKIFDRFTQADASTTRKHGGTGLGMSITLSLVKLMGGEIELTSKEGLGTSVTVILPLDKTSLINKNQRIKHLNAPVLLGKKVLIAEDNKINQVVIRSMLEPTNAALTIVENGVEALHAVKSENFDLILMDIHMPEMDGKEAQLEIAKINPNIPVVALTANVMPEDVACYLNQGFVYHLAKPLDMNLLYGVIKNYTF
ncbi:MULTISPECIES: PAS domain-containing hybrid sensor histidine kinase/response regulator [unclassified Pseudoalteromonas]|uniref:PAS domain-containing hybrid sensor histidine kinase/response regulator n=1 Tax=unclassified Pseudoalteromonas TaxID=194690 RepID=UPI0030142E58